MQKRICISRLISEFELQKADAKEESTKKQLSELANQALTRAETLRDVNRRDPIARQTSRIESGLGQLSVTPATSVPSTPRPAQPSNLSGGLKVIGNSSYSREEIAVLRATSVINGREYVPFLSVDLKERFAYPIPFTDKSGHLKISRKQQSRFARWARLEDLTPTPKVFRDASDIDCFNIKQTLVSDCSFITALTVAALYEKRFKKKLISNIIYPQNRRGEPVFNPCGKYMIRLHLNGVYRKVRRGFLTRCT